MKILFYSYYYFPDFCAGSFRAKGFTNAFTSSNKIDSTILITTQPNRYGRKSTLPSIEQNKDLSIIRVRVPEHHNKFARQILSFFVYFFRAFYFAFINRTNYDIVLTTSSRTGTSFLGYLTSKFLKKPHFMDIRDIFSDNLHSVLKSNLINNSILNILHNTELKMVKKAKWVNLVSPGFISCFDEINIKNFHVYTNGIDTEFLSIKSMKSKIDRFTDKKIIIYAGNIGFGQNLEKIILPLAQHFKNQIEFIIIGDGSSKKILTERITLNDFSNISVFDPIPRNELIEWYKYADILFFHLSNIPAFRNVIPSKIFEYSVFNKPILAGVNGTAKTFLQNNVLGSFVFEPEDVSGAIDQLNLIIEKGTLYNRRRFINEYSRSNIMKQVADSIAIAYR